MTLQQIIKEAREQIDKHPPILCEFIPKGRGATDAVAYKVMNRLIRINRRKLWSMVNESWTQMMLHGTGMVKVPDWDYEGRRPR